MSGRTIHSSRNSPRTYCASAMCPPSFAYLVLSRVISPVAINQLNHQKCGLPTRQRDSSKSNCLVDRYNSQCSSDPSIKAAVSSPCRTSESVSLGITMSYNIQEGEFVQILNTSHGHWLIIFTVGLKHPHVQVFDSLYYSSIPIMAAKAQN